MLQTLKRYTTTEGARVRQLESLLKKWLTNQLLPPAPNRPRAVTFKLDAGDRSCFLNPLAVEVGGTSYIDIDVRDEQGSKVLMTLRISPDRGQYVKTLWR
jgi:hypothetical protein